MQTYLTLPQIEAFLVLEARASFSEAAAELGVSQPAFSRTIQQIETRLGVRLFDRDTRYVRLTAAGEQLRPIAMRLMKEYERSFTEFQSYVDGYLGRIRLATLPSVAATLLPGALRRFVQAHPGISVDVWEDVTIPVHMMVENGEVEIGLAPPPREGRALNFRRVLDDTLVLAFRVDDPLAQYDVLDWTMLRNRPLVAMSTDTGLRALIDRALETAGITRDVPQLFNCKYQTTALAFVAASLGVSVQTRLAIAQALPPGVTWRPLAGPSVERPIGLIVDPARSMMQHTRALMREIEREARELDIAFDLHGQRGR
ncbi:LysR family transcriptional regulator [Sphingomonas sp. BK235]|uniref:LysR family transcriptional regulator n=1 Tax=Sphingomonas sp. BK235 TaxID=2512131 RepID=UPI001044C68F|nr:LysR family transcriptional regulator [Sphingomonas sp. BK235]TCP31011.1 LysR family carnitine catabolism transcriptional activator [Sphingomonas sp. BK235]